MIDLNILENAVRLTTAGALMVIALAILVSRPKGPAAWVGPIFFLSATGHALFNCALLRGAEGDLGALLTVTWALGTLGVGFFWLFVLALFEDEGRVPPWRLALIAVQFALGWIGRFSPAPVDQIAWTAFHLISFAMVIMTFAAIWRSRRDDLVEPRRRLRAPVMVAAGAYILLIVATDLAGAYGYWLEGLRLIEGFALLGLALAATTALVRLDPVLVASPVRVRGGAAEAPDAGALARLAKAMDQEQAWRREDLTIGALAEQVGLPEHRLRRLINGELGHRNFAAFVNARRIAAAKVALRDPAQARTSVSTIAYDLGFGSLGPFNRAFKDATGVTPTAWRSSPISESLAET